MSTTIHQTKSYLYLPDSNNLFAFRKKSRKYAPLGAQDLELWAPREIGIWSFEKQSWS